MADSPLKQRFVLDTSVFITEAIRDDGQDLEGACLDLLTLIADAKLTLNISCYMPPTIDEELTQMLRDRDVDEAVFAKLDTWVITKAPARYEVQVPAHIVYQFVDEMSDRVNRGLRVAEKAVREAEGSSGDPVDDHDHMTEVDRVVSDLRDEYRRALRQGVLDSREDFDLLILARELEAGVVTEDQGIVGWADDFGLRYLEGRNFPALLREYLVASGHEDYVEG